MFYSHNELFFHTEGVNGMYLAFFYNNAAGLVVFTTHIIA